jgi:CDP-diacylglycerol--serine O-phosphatidyltransferase
LGWAAGFVYVTAAALRLARFNIQGMALTDKRYFAGLPSPAAASVTASTVFLYPWGLQDPRIAALALPMLLVPGFLMVSTIRFRSVKAIDVGWRRSPVWLLLGAIVIAAIAAHPRIALVVLSYSYVTAALLMFVYSRLRRRPAPSSATPSAAPDVATDHRDA